MFFSKKVLREVIFQNTNHIIAENKYQEILQERVISLIE